jgi:dihydroflavonol-4-reductase
LQHEFGLLRWLLAAGCVTVAGDFLSIRDIARVLKPRMGASARRVPTLPLPSWLVRIAALRVPR